MRIFMRMLLNKCLLVPLVLFCSQITWAVSLERINLDFSEMMPGTLNIWSSDNLLMEEYCRSWVTSFEAPKENQNFDHKYSWLRFQGRYLYRSNHGNQYDHYCSTSEFKLKRVDLQTGKIESFLPPANTENVPIGIFLMSPSGKYGLFEYDYNNSSHRVYFSDLSSGQHVNRIETDKIGTTLFSFLSDDTAVIFDSCLGCEPVKGSLVTPTGEIANFKLSLGLPKEFKYGLRKYRIFNDPGSRKLHMIDYAAGIHIVLDFDRIDSNGNVAFEMQKAVYPYYEAGYFIPDFIGFQFTDYKNNMDSVYREERTISVKSNYKDMKFLFIELNFETHPNKNFSMSITKDGKEKRYKNFPTSCFEMNLNDQPVQGDLFDQPPKLPNFCVGSIIDGLTKDSLSTLYLPEQSVYFKFPLSVDYQSAIGTDKGKGSCYNAYSGPKNESTDVCTYELGPIAELDNSTLVRTVTMEDKRGNDGFIQRSYKEQWSVTTPDGKSYPYQRKSK